MSDLEHIRNYCNSGDTDYLYLIEDQATIDFLQQAATYVVNQDEREFMYVYRALGILAAFLESDMETEEVETCSVTGLRNTGNSCYLDSTIVALLAVPNDFTDEYILDAKLQERPQISCSKGGDPKEDLHNRRAVQKALIEIAKSIRGEKTVEHCVNLRKLLARCPTSIAAFHRTGQEDAGEFLTYLISLFNTDVAWHSVSTYFYNDPEDKVFAGITVDDKASVVQSVDPRTIQETPDLVLSSLLNRQETMEFDDANLAVFEGKRYRYRETLVDVVSPYLVFNLRRLLPREIVQTEIQLEPNFMNNGYQFTLTAVVVHVGTTRGGHYVAYILCKGVWWLYDDLQRGLEYVGSFEELKEAEPSPLTRGVQYYYV